MFLAAFAALTIIAGLLLTRLLLEAVRGHRHDSPVREAERITARAALDRMGDEAADVSFDWGRP